MEDKKRKKEEKRKREASQKIAEQKNKVPDLTKPTSAQSPATPSSASPSPGPPSSSSPSPATAAAGAPPQGGNNAKRPAVANGQPPSSAQAPQRYMPREVPPRFRCQQDHKVLLKRGQPPLSCMLLGGGNGGGAAPSVAGRQPHCKCSWSLRFQSWLSGFSCFLTSPLLLLLIIVIISRCFFYFKLCKFHMGCRLWQPAPLSGLGEGAGGTETGGAHNSSASWSDRHLQQQRAAGTGPAAGKAGNSGSPSPPSSSSCSPNECTQSGGVAWGSSSQAGVGGSAVTAGAVPSKSKASSFPGTPDGAIGVSGGIPSANFSPNANPSAWPALVQDGTAGTVAEGITSSLPSPPSLSANPTLSHPTTSVNPASNQNQLNEMEGGDREHPHGEWGVTGSEPGAGPKKSAEDMDCGTAGAGDLPASLSSSGTSSSSWRAQPFSSNSKTGASRTDSWEDRAGGGEVPGEGGSSWGYGSLEGKGGGGSAGAKGWAAGSGGNCKTPGVTQGAWGTGAGEELLVGEWGNSGGAADTGGSCNLAGGSGGSSNSSSSSGGSVGNPPTSASPVSMTMTRAWDNQKGIGEGGAGEAGEWGGQGKGGAGTSSSSGGGRSRAGSGPLNQRHHRPSQAPANAEVALQNLLSRTDLDPRVLSNTGWGQTQIQQNVAWDLEGDGRGSGSSSSAFSSSTMNTTNPALSYSATTSSTTTDPSLTSPLPGVPASASLNSNLTPGATASGEGWEGGGNNSLLTRGPPPCGPNVQNRSGTQSVSASSGGCVGALGNQPSGQGKNSGSWGGMVEGQGKGWGNEGQEWRDRRGGSGGDWGEFGQQGTTAGGGWGAGQEEKGTGGWKEMGREGGGWGQRSGGDWGEPEPKTGSVGWGDGKGGGAGGDSETASWGSWEEGGPRRGWGGGGGDMGGKPHQGWGGKAHPPQIPNSQAASLKGPAQQPQQQSQPQQQQPPPDPGAMQSGWGRVGGPSSQNQNQNQSSGWSSGPIPQISSGPGDGMEPSGWEEPSPQSISRKMEIDDGTSAWGDPSRYNNKSVNLWDKNSGTTLQTQGPAQQHQGQPAGQQPQTQPPGRAAHPATAPGNPGQGPGKSPGIAPALWGNRSAPSGPAVELPGGRQIPPLAGETSRILGRALGGETPPPIQSSLVRSLCKKAGVRGRAPSVHPVTPVGKRKRTAVAYGTALGPRVAAPPTTLADGPRAMEARRAAARLR
ncbi:hypothetical protein AGOR_G00227690 [Albula goreensis]|uniref:Uncharacterized protein n=1 Tax=Albula goreensis TaxID=1534307 RepID=A0A8T3CN09_9TELE|nr:hypothetical protein AGOR_G00227690 [Albula goreensis]